MRPRLLVCLLFLVVLCLSGCANLQSLPEGVSYEGSVQPVQAIDFLADLTYVDDAGRRHVEQEIFDTAFSMIDRARRLVLVDMFLYNDFQGASREETRPLAEEMTARLVQRKLQHPSITIVVITDPINTLYGGRHSAYFERLTAAGIPVIETDLTVLRDSNAVYSLFWRLFIRPFGNTINGSALPNPVGDGRVSVRSYLSLLNFKANHRKVLITDEDDGLQGLVTSANPHDGSSAHHNVAVRFDGPAAVDLLRTELAVLAFSGAAITDEALRTDRWMGAHDSPLTDLRLQVLTEYRIKQAVLQSLDAARAGDRVDLVMFYLSDRDVVEALKRARKRGVAMRVLLDPNKDAFGRQKNGIPNRQVAHELHRQGVPVRWCDTHGEQCHSKMLLVRRGDDDATVILGSANLTRRNLDDFNLETNVAVYGPQATPFFVEARDYVDLLWNNEPGRRFSVDYGQYRDESLFRRGLYRFMEASGISTF